MRREIVSGAGFGFFSYFGQASLSGLHKVILYGSTIVPCLSQLREILMVANFDACMLTVNCITRKAKVDFMSVF